MPTMLPSVPKTLGRLGDVLTSALLSISGEANPLHLASARSGIVILVDGLGWQNLRAAGGHARFLNSVAEGTKAINTVLPSTTAAALTTLATGIAPNAHGIVGYRVLDKTTGRDHNLLSGWTGFDESAGWRTGDTVSDRAGNAGNYVNFIGPAAYQRSGFTNIMMPAANYLVGDTVAERFRIALQAAAEAGNLCYLYVPELDQAAHAHGVDSQKWLGLLEELDGLARTLAQELPRGVGAILTADHGVIDVPRHAQLDIFDLGLGGVRFWGGDTRCGYLYLDGPERLQSAREAIEGAYGSAVSVVTPGELVEAGWMAPPTNRSVDLLPDLIVLANKDVALYYKGFSSFKSYQMVGHHGSWSATELQIPLLRFGVWNA